MISSHRCGGACLCVFQELGALALLRWLRIGLRTSREKATVDRRSDCISWPASFGSATSKGWSAAGGPLPEPWWCGRRLALGPGERLELDPLSDPCCPPVRDFFTACCDLSPFSTHLP